MMKRKRISQRLSTSSSQSSFVLSKILSGPLESACPRVTWTRVELSECLSVRGTEYRGTQEPAFRINIQSRAKLPFISALPKRCLAVASTDHETDLMVTKLCQPGFFSVRLYTHEQHKGRVVVLFFLLLHHDTCILQRGVMLEREILFQLISAQRIDCSLSTTI